MICELKWGKLIINSAAHVKFIALFLWVTGLDNM